ncbi:monofunctional biosynthetic peptidoglycan transglycosylase [Mangrovibrevibacter kandeliae]|uniref:monofunctional biosynthetic peptidoglycan transglycosylase n=1 Tax=Mangrovibrevibacter kandeliae TaxID=2968473 RepID=UPI002118F8D2|nr:monofunctional biosynthetic peptidoglycan transglycosylase [Aurantimonas sp. CSK15Z-1]MCQ8780628.1 monofunctional biosynthetic peptidoglycan transglycosylase [Aurantimonas sp. CSK15Z-1]
MFGRTLRIAAMVLACLVAVPLVLVPVYAIPAVHPVSTLMLYDHFTFQDSERVWVRLDAIAPVLVYSVMMSEDGRFCEHDGIDWGAMSEVVDAAASGEATRGASTITMQTMKNLFLWTSRSYVRKVLEAPLALYADAILSKRRLIEIYLNIVEWDEGVYGVEAAAQHYFKVPASRLTPRQAALLAVTLPAPQSRNPAKPGRGLSRLARTIEARARASGDYVGCVKSASR